MELKHYFILDSGRNVVPGAKCTLFIAGTTELATGIQDAKGNPLDNPLTADDDGLVIFAAPDGRYDLVTEGGVSIPVQFMDVLSEKVNLYASSLLDRSTGGIQILDLDGNLTLDLSGLKVGQSVFYRVTGGARYSLSYSGLGSWSDGSTPILRDIHYLEFVHDGVEVVGFDCGGR